MVKKKTGGQYSKLKVTVWGLGGGRGGDGGGGQATLGVVPRPIPRGPVTREGGAPVHGIVGIAYIVHLIDPNRRPRTIIEAQCSTSCCRRRSDFCCADGIRPGCSRCQPIYYYVHVLRRTGCDVVTRMFKYETKLERVVAGCTCVKIPDALSPQVPTMVA